MSDSPNPFRVVLRGYDPSQVDRRVSELVESAEPPAGRSRRSRRGCSSSSELSRQRGEPGRGPPGRAGHLQPPR